MTSKPSGKFFRTDTYELAEELHNENGEIVGIQIICSAYPSISARLLKNDSTYIYRLKVETHKQEQYMFDFSPTVYYFSPITIKRKLAKKSILPIAGMEKRFNTYLKQSAERVKYSIDEESWEPLTDSA